jgi:hypothetical protein
LSTYISILFGGGEGVRKDIKKFLNYDIEIVHGDQSSKSLGYVIDRVSVWYVTYIYKI